MDGKRMRRRIPIKLLSVLKRNLIAVIIFVLSSAAIFWFIGRPMLKFVSAPEQFRAWVDGHGIWGRIAFIGMMALQIVVAVIPGEPLEIGAGYAFGIWEGTARTLLWNKSC